MTSRFVSSGTIAGDGEAAEAPPAVPPLKAQTAQWDKEAPKKNTEWEAVQKELEAQRQQREQARKANVEGGGEQSLHDILQANKAAKQAAFEEQNRIRNQFRALDDDEVDYLDSIKDARKMEEDRVKRETEERLASFRKAQKTPAGGGGGTNDDGAAVDEADETVVTWAAAGRKRKREREAKGVVKGVKRRASDGGKEAKAGVAADVQEKPSTATAPPNVSEAKSSELHEPTALASAPAPATAQAKPKLGLVDYGSDEDDDD
ncbi:Uu.00g007180.m01.CDS01 [Anthostomella pinea]|uniref:Uu.00g007180.m01.CDS01 n=1 Tax=Anthostomella pinea TaxID=933095 RepID=A0AAI8VXM6_9PEZI|nr:Uu.00g007180.m01.CDS01 [Anthostomella pinea]